MLLTTMRPVKDPEAVREPDHGRHQGHCEDEGEESYHQPAQPLQEEPRSHLRQGQDHRETDAKEIEAPGKNDHRATSDRISCTLSSSCSSSAGYSGTEKRCSCNHALPGKGLLPGSSCHSGW